MSGCYVLVCDHILHERKSYVYIFSSHFSCFQTLYKTQVKELKEEIEERNRQTQDALKKVQDMYSEK